MESGILTGHGVDGGRLLSERGAHLTLLASEEGCGNLGERRDRAGGIGEFRRLGFAACWCKRSSAMTGRDCTKLEECLQIWCRFAARARRNATKTSASAST